MFLKKNTYSRVTPRAGGDAINCRRPLLLVGPDLAFTAAQVIALTHSLLSSSQRLMRE